eukprot:4926576-Prymnesium_polylepis.1
MAMHSCGEMAWMQSELEAPATSAKKKAKKQRAAVLDELLGGPKDGGSRATSGGSDGSSRKKKDGRFAFLPFAVWSALGFGKCGGTTSVRVRLEA